VSRSVWSFAKGPHCCSVGFLAFSLTSLMQTQAAPHLAVAPSAEVKTTSTETPAQPAAVAPAVSAASAAPAAASNAPTAAELVRVETILPLSFEDHGVPEAPFGDLIYSMAGQYAVNPYLVAALIQVESAFNPRAVSRKGARGLMQLLPETARRFGLSKRRDLFDPAKNMEAGIRYLRWLSDRFSGDAARVLAAYNAGEGAVDRFGGVPPFQETRNYVTRIFGLLGLVPPLAIPLAAEDDDAVAGR
jgi:soluble lytic murein transglycosylase-like protein